MRCGMRPSAPRNKCTRKKEKGGFLPRQYVSVPIIWSPALHEATPEQHKHYEIGGRGISLHWPDLDEDLSVANLMAGVDWAST